MSSILYTKGDSLVFNEIFPASPSSLNITQLTGVLISNYGQTGQNVQELPVCVSGLQGRFLFATAASKAFHLRAQEGDHFYIDGVLSSSREIAIATPAVGDSFSFYSFKSGEDSYDWYINTEKGTLQEEVYRYIFDATPSSAETLTLNLSLPAGKEITIDWGDGNTTTVTGEVTETDYSNAYASAGTYPVTIYGDFDALTRLEIKNVAVDGDLKDIGTLTGLTYFRCGNNTLTGDIVYLPRGLIYFRAISPNTIYGNLANLPRTLTYFYCSGSNTIYGDIGNLPVGLTYFRCFGSNTVYGVIDNLPAGLIAFNCGGFNTITGDIGYLPTRVTYFKCTGSNTINSYTSRTWTTKPATFRLVPIYPGGLSSAEIDQLLIDFDNDLTWAPGDVIQLTGANAPRTSASDAVVANMISEGATVTTN